MKIAFIGGGNMGEAMLAAVLARKLGAPVDVSTSDVRRERLQLLKSKYGVAVTEGNRQAASGRDVVVLAVKPQTLPAVMTDLKGQLEAHQLVLSIIAGARVDTLRRGLGHERIVRAMPNTPAQIGAGITAWTATAGVAEAQRGQARAILEAMGQELYFDEERYLDMATAVSGSGPAYFFLLAEAMVEAAASLGFPRPTAETLVLATFSGSARLLEESGLPPGELRRNVTSPGGTTAEALRVLDEGRFSELVRRAIAAAHERAQELGK